MAITLAPSLPAAVVGGAAYTAGQGMAQRYYEQLMLEQQERDRRHALSMAGLAEQQRQFDERNALSQSQFAEGQRQFDAQLAQRGQALNFDQNMARAQFRQQGQQNAARNALAARQQALAARENAARLQMQYQQFNQQMADRERQRQFGIYSSHLDQNNAMQRAAFAAQNQAALQDNRNQFAADQNLIGMAHDLRMQEMRESGLSQRAQENYNHQLELIRNKNQVDRLNSDWATLQENRYKLDPGQYEELVGQFQERYAGLDMPLPVQVKPPEPKWWEDPEQKLGRVQEFAPDAPWTVDEKGNPMLPRGFTPEMSPAFRQFKQEEAEQQHKFEMEKEQQEAAVKQQEQRASNAQAYNARVSKAITDAQRFTIKDTNRLGKTIEKPDLAKQQRYIKAETIRARGAFSAQPNDLDPSLPTVPPQLQGLPYLLPGNEVAEAEAMNDGELVVVLRNGQWVVQRVTRKAPNATAPQPTTSTSTQPPAAAAVAGGGVGGGYTADEYNSVIPPVLRDAAIPLTDIIGQSYRNIAL